MTTTAGATTETTPESLPSRRRGRLLTVVAALLALLVLVFYGGGGWYFSGVLDQRALDAEARRASLYPRYDFEIAGVSPASVTLRVPDDPGHLLRPGVWGVGWPAGYGWATDILEQAPGRVTRRFQVVQGQPPRIGEMVEFEARALPDDPTGVLDPSPLPVTYPGPLGDYPAWWFPGRRATWVILVHGNGLDIADHAKLVPSLHEAGYSVLAITYRNAPDAPLDPSGKLGYGATEWADIEAAVRYAGATGAEEVVLIGASMGGAAVTRFLYDSPDAAAVAAVVLEAPMLDFGRTVDLNAARETLPVVGAPVPQSLTTVAKWLASLRFGIDWGEVDLLSRSAELGHPVLIFHGTDDVDVPIATSREMADRRPDLVTLVEVSLAPHMGAWNVDPWSFESRLLEFLDTHTSSGDSPEASRPEIRGLT
jgi:uncharacterized protein